MIVRPRFNLRWLLAGIGVVAVLLWSATQLGMSRGTVTIVDQQLQIDQKGRASGQISWRFVDGGRGVYGDYVCTVNRVGPSKLNKLSKGDRLVYRYRIQDWGGLKAENPHRVFLTRVLRIDESDIVGYARMKDWTEIVLSGADAEAR